MSGRSETMEPLHELCNAGGYEAICITGWAWGGTSVFFFLGWMNEKQCFKYT